MNLWVSDGLGPEEAPGTGRYDEAGDVSHGGAVESGVVGMGITTHSSLSLMFRHQGSTLKIKMQIHDGVKTAN